MTGRSMRVDIRKKWWYNKLLSIRIIRYIFIGFKKKLNTRKHVPVLLRMNGSNEHIKIFIFKKGVPYNTGEEYKRIGIFLLINLIRSHSSKRDSAKFTNARDAAFDSALAAMRAWDAARVNESMVEIAGRKGKDQNQSFCKTRGVIWRFGDSSAWLRELPIFIPEKEWRKMLTILEAKNQMSIFSRKLMLILLLRKGAITRWNIRFCALHRTLSV